MCLFSRSLSVSHSHTHTHTTLGVSPPLSSLSHTSENETSVLSLSLNIEFWTVNFYVSGSSASSVLATGRFWGHVPSTARKQCWCWTTWWYNIMTQRCLYSQCFYISLVLTVQITPPPSSPLLFFNKYLTGTCCYYKKIIDVAVSQRSQFDTKTDDLFIRLISWNVCETSSFLLSLRLWQPLPAFLFSVKISTPWLVSSFLCLKP